MIGKHLKYPNSPIVFLHDVNCPTSKEPSGSDTSSTNK